MPVINLNNSHTRQTKEVFFAKGTADITNGIDIITSTGEIIDIADAFAKFAGQNIKVYLLKENIEDLNTTV